MKSNKNEFWKAFSHTNALYSTWAALTKNNYYVTFILYALDAQKNMTQKKLCAYTGLTKQTVNGVIKSLTEKGYIKLQPGIKDRREKQILLTESGISYSRNMLSSLYELEDTVFKMMGADRIQNMIDEIRLFNMIFENELRKKGETL